MPLVEYLVARAGPPPRRGRAYDYVLAGDGLYVVADHDWLEARVPGAPCIVPGLPPLSPACILKPGRIPHSLWQEIVEIALAWATSENEVLVAVAYHPTRGYHLVVPPQVVSPGRIVYQPASRVVLELHSHHGLPA